MFLAANEPHAYLDGNCVECMACSDNVVRAGLTPKFKDVNQLCDMLTYSTRDAAQQLFEPVEQDGALVYRVAIDDFIVARSQVQGAGRLAPVDGASILLVTEGHGTAPQHATDLKPGHVCFLAANTGVYAEKNEMQKGQMKAKIGKSNAVLCV